VRDGNVIFLQITYRLWGDKNLIIWCEGHYSGEKTRVERTGKMFELDPLGEWERIQGLQWFCEKKKKAGWGEG